MIARALLVVATAALFTSPTSEANEGTSPFTLCVARERDLSRERGAASIAVVRAAYRQLDEAQRRELRDALEEAVSRREARLNPFAVDLEDDEPDARLERFFESAPRVFGTARMLTASRYCGADGFCVRATRGACSDRERLPVGREVDRARFLAWPYGHAARLRESNPKARAAAIASLRRDPDVALVLEGDAAPASLAEREALDLFERWEKLKRLEHDSGPDADAQPADAPWDGPGDAVVVVPTLEAVAKKPSL